MSTLTRSHRRPTSVTSIADDLERIRLEHRAQRIEHVLGRIRHRSGPSAHQPAGRLAVELTTELQMIQERLDALSAHTWD